MPMTGGGGAAEELAPGLPVCSGSLQVGQVLVLCLRDLVPALLCPDALCGTGGPGFA